MPSLGEVVTLAVRDRHADHLAGVVAARERRIGALDLQVHVAADELDARIALQDAGQQFRFAQDLEAVAYAHHKAALARMIAHGGHDRRVRGDRAAAQVVTVGEPAGEDDKIGACGQFALAVPYHRGLAARHEPKRMRHVALAVRSGEDDDRGPHPVTSTRKFSITVLASSFSAASFSVASAFAASPPVKLDVEHLALPHARDARDAERLQRALDRLPLRIEHAILQRDSDAGFHRVVLDPQMRRGPIGPRVTWSMRRLNAVL